MQEVIIAKNLRKVYDKDIEAVKSLDISIRKGEVFGFLGPNGAGKSTSINMFTGIIKPTSGNLEILGLTIPQDSDKLNELIGYVPQNLVFYDHLTIIENLQLFGIAYELKDLDERIAYLLDLLKIKKIENQRTGTLSGGQKRRLNLAIGLLNSPKILFLDEPSAGMDPQSRNILWETIESLAKDQGMTIILTTHLMETADRLSDRIAIIDHGILQIIDTPDGLKKKFGNGEVIDLNINAEVNEDLIEQLLQELMDLFNADKIHFLNKTISVHTENGIETLQEIFQILEKLDARNLVQQLSIRQNSLEDVFIKLTGRSLRE